MHAIRAIIGALLCVLGSSSAAIAQTAPAARSAPASRLAPSQRAASQSQPATAPAGARITEEGWFAPAEANRPALPKEVTRAFVIPIRQEIKRGTLDSFKRRIARCREANAELIVLDMDSWGGLMLDALDISRIIKTDLDGIYTVCFVRTKAVASATTIALACHEIVMTPVGMIGACAPILPGKKLDPVTREKIESVLRAEFAESAKRNGYNIALVQSMVSADEAWLIRNKKTRELRYVQARDWRGKVTASEGLISAPSASQSDWELLKVAVAGDEPLTARTSDAVQFGFVRNVVKAAPDQPYEAMKELYHIRGDLTVLPVKSMSFAEALTRVEAASRPEAASQPGAGSR